jgi:rhamnose utilization protein RhaD (predicted bifunctional aldolase and dehydrogenase)/NAD(P)-dependent dehydrogenase (short-subunit alcohol dehydrogenase family)
MTDRNPSSRVIDPGIADRAPATLDALIQLSRLIGRDPRLVQPGGGNTSIKLTLPDDSGGRVEALLVKGSGTDLRSIGPEGFTRLSLARLAPLRQAEAMSDAEMMRFMAGCMLGDGPAPSVETPLHSLLPHRVIAHTHDIATMSLTNVPDGTAERLIRELFQGDIVYVPYVPPGFPLAKAVGKLADRIPPAAIGLALAHHGLVVWGNDPKECESRLLRSVARIDQYLESCRSGRGRGPILGPSRGSVPTPDERRRLAEVVLPAVRGALSSRERVILHFDDDETVLATLASERVPELVRRGMATPEHLLRAGRLPVWLELDPTAPTSQVVAQVQSQIAASRAEYEEYHGRHAVAGEPPLDDWAKVVLAPGLGLITAFADKRGAITANLCYRAVLQSIENAEAVDRFEFISEEEVFRFEHWPLERRKVEEQLAKDRATKLLARHVVVVIGGGSGIGKSAAARFAEAGAHVVVADLDNARANGVAGEIASRFPGRAIGSAVDVRSDAGLDELFRRAVLEFGGVDCLFYTAGSAPRFAPITDIRREDLQRQLEVHYLGAIAALGRAARIMQRQRLGGSIVASVSKAALVPGREAVAYGGSKAALLQALRVAAMELGGDAIRVNAINADQVDTPLFREFVRERAACRGVTVEEQLEIYRSRNLMGVSLIPPDVVADLAVLLASDRFRYTTGDILTVDGGLPEAFPR